jgi:1-aminocyclopropane-1-carboxylate deaminase/D-cysteine desulfhydrase-like pyridoxal-dependent ACC family enzyme
MDTSKLKRLTLGQYPTPVHHVAALSVPGCDLWVKRDDLTHEAYGGNKVRKLEYLLAAARASGAKSLVTVGAAGSHHVLATTYFGVRAGFSIEAVLVPQPRTEHAVEVLRASLALGLRPFPVRSTAAVPLAIARRIAAGSSFIPLGGSSVTGTMGYVDAARELGTQVRQGAMPEPDFCVVALGSAGTAAGLAAGFAELRMKTRVVGIGVSRPFALSRVLALKLARGCARRVGMRDADATWRRQLAFDARFLGAGYGHATILGDEATRDAREGAQLALDPTYTAKAFAAALWHVRARRASCILYWHTLSSRPIGPLMLGAVDEPARDATMRLLFGSARSSS